MVCVPTNHQHDIFAFPILRHTLFVSPQTIRTIPSRNTTGLKPLLQYASTLWFFYVLLSIFKKINLVNPFDQLIGKLFSKLSLVSFAIGVLSKVTFELSSKYISQGMNFPNLIEHIIHGDAFLFFAGILFFVSMLYKRGIELQTENDLTI